jgi:hypothetical protein
MPRTPTYEELLTFTKEIASHLKDGDGVYKCNNCSLTSNDKFDVCEQCGTSDQCYYDEYEADRNDDEVDALYAFISQARDFLGTDGSNLTIPTMKPEPFPEALL